MCQWWDLTTMVVCAGSQDPCSYQRACSWPWPLLRSLTLIVCNGPLPLPKYLQLIRSWVYAYETLVTTAACPGFYILDLEVLLRTPAALANPTGSPLQTLTMDYTVVDTVYPNRKNQRDITPLKGHHMPSHFVSCVVSSEVIVHFSVPLSVGESFLLLKSVH